jgi:hypothetical protein
VFPREGRADAPVSYEVIRYHDGRSLATLSIVATQSEGRPRPGRRSHLHGHHPQHLVPPNVAHRRVAVAADSDQRWRKRVRSQVPDLTSESTRKDPGIRDVESVRCRLQMLTNVLNLWETYDLGRLLDEALD